jgi:gamma-glutamyltranspeptidase/glutathione hydrolase
MTTRQNRLATLVPFLFLAACGAEPPGPATGTDAVALAAAGQTSTAVAPATGTAGMVATAHPLATDVGVRILESGGNAFDAAVAVAAALNVVEPMMSGMGGYGTILVYSAEEGRTRFLNPSGRIPAGVIGDAYRPPTPGYMENRRGAKAVSTPGNVNAWAAMHGSYGSLEWSELFAPAIGLARDGFEVDELTAVFIDRSWDEFPEHARAFYGSEGEPLSAGKILVQADLASSFELLATEGPVAFSEGPIGQAIDQAMREADGFLRLRDLQENEAEWWEPIEIDYRGHRVVTASPPANSFPALVRLGMMSRYDLQALGHNTADYLHTFAEVTKHAFWTRLAYAGDPDIAPPPLDMLLSEAYWAEQADHIDPAAASVFEPPVPVAHTGMNTTHYVVADRWGNVVSATQTLGNLFGARIMPEGTGIWLNNSLAYSTFEPEGNPMDAFPGRRKLSGDVPLFVVDEAGRPVVAVGTPGGHTIGQTVPQIVMNHLDFRMDIQAAIAAPRISFVEPNTLVLEEAFGADVVAALEARGHRIGRAGALGNAHGLTVGWGEDGLPAAFTGGSDPRGVGRARGLLKAGEGTR